MNSATLISKLQLISLALALCITTFILPEPRVHAQSSAPSTGNFYINSKGMLTARPNTIVGSPQATENQMLRFARTINPKFPADLPKLYLEVGRKYGIRGDIAFCQMIKETGFHRFGGDVRSQQYNYSGIGATGRGSKGNTFKTKKDGVTAHIQHLYAYATSRSLPRGERLLDPRFRYVKRGTAPYWTSLNGRWAVPGRGYGQDILSLHSRLLVTRK